MPYEWDRFKDENNWSFEWVWVDKEHGIEGQVMRFKGDQMKEKEWTIKNQKLDRICKDLTNQLNKVGFLSYGYLYNALGIKMPDESSRYRFYTGDRQLWKESIQKEIGNLRISLTGVRANAKGLAEQERHFLELTQREISKADMLEKKIDILEDLIK